MKRYEIVFKLHGRHNDPFVVPVEPTDTEDDALLLAAYALSHITLQEGVTDAVLHIQTLQ